MREKLNQLLYLKKIYKSCVIWGTGNTSELLQEGLARISNDLEVLAYTDSSPEKWGTKWNGKPVVPPEEVAQIEADVVLISVGRKAALNEIIRRCEEIGISEYDFFDSYILKLHSEEVLKCFDLLEDEESKYTYYRLIEARTTGILKPADILKCDKQYFAVRQFMNCLKEGTFVDCGSFTGETVEQFIWEMGGIPRRIIAIEPDRKNFMALTTRMKRINAEWNIPDGMIELLERAVSDRNDIVFVDRITNTNGIGSKVHSEKEGLTEKCMAISIDETIDEKVAFIKADVESYEYKALVGAKKTIQKWHPNLAISIYHNAIDLFSLQLLISDFVSDYHFAIRHHTYSLEDTVLYAWVETDDE